MARCEVDAVAEARDGGAPLLTSIKAVNEYDTKISGDWRRVLELQRASVLAQEMKNNSAKMARWAAQALLAGVDQIKLGYVSFASVLHRCVLLVCFDSHVWPSTVS